MFPFCFVLRTMITRSALVLLHSFTSAERVLNVGRLLQVFIPALFSSSNMDSPDTCRPFHFPLSRSSSFVFPNHTPIPTDFLLTQFISIELMLSVENCLWSKKCKKKTAKCGSHFDSQKKIVVVAGPGIEPGTS